MNQLAEGGKARDPASNPEGDQGQPPAAMPAVTRAPWGTKATRKVKSTQLVLAHLIGQTARRVIRASLALTCDAITSCLSIWCSSLGFFLTLLYKNKGEGCGGGGVGGGERGWGSNSFGSGSWPKWIVRFGWRGGGVGGSPSADFLTSWTGRLFHSLELALLSFSFSFFFISHLALQQQQKTILQGTMRGGRR